MHVVTMSKYNFDLVAKVVGVALAMEHLAFLT